MAVCAWGLMPSYTSRNCIDDSVDVHNRYKRYVRAIQLVGGLRPLVLVFDRCMYLRSNAVSFCVRIALFCIINMTTHVSFCLFQCEAGTTNLLGRPVGACPSYGKPSPSSGAPNLMEQDRRIQYIARVTHPLVDNEYKSRKLRFCGGNLDPCSNSDGWRLLAFGNGPGSWPAAHCDIFSINLFDSDRTWSFEHRSDIFKYVFNMSQV